MPISIKELDKLLKTLRKHGVTAYQSADLHLQIDISHTPLSVPTTSTDIVSSEELSEDDLIDWSSQQPA